MDVQRTSVPLHCLPWIVYSNQDFSGGHCPKEVHKHSISISIWIFTSGGGPRRYTNILFLFLFRFSPTAAAHGGTQIISNKIFQNLGLNHATFKKSIFFAGSWIWDPRPSSKKKSPTAPAEVHKYSISISIQIFTGGGGPQRYTNILFLFLFRFSPTAAAHGGTQIFYSNLGQIDYSGKLV